MPKDPPPPTFPKNPTGETWGKIYDCGCKAYGGKELPDYCPEHGKPPKPEKPPTPQPQTDSDPPPVDPDPPQK